jgi:hypothetical protein
VQALAERLDDQGLSRTGLRSQVAHHFALSYLKRWDDEFRWDAPNMDEATEDFFYSAMIRFALEMEVSKETLNPPDEEG